MVLYIYGSIVYQKLNIFLFYLMQGFQTNSSTNMFRMQPVDGDILLFFLHKATKKRQEFLYTIIYGLKCSYWLFDMPKSTDCLFWHFNKEHWPKSTDTDTGQGVEVKPSRLGLVRTVLLFSPSLSAPTPPPRPVFFCQKCLSQMYCRRGPLSGPFWAAHGTQPG